jgi:hypothetical protein
MATMMPMIFGNDEDGLGFDCMKWVSLSALHLTLIA